LRVFKLFENQLFVPSSSFTLLDEITCITGFGGAKGGKKMVFQWGTTVMNVPKPDSSAALDVLSAMERFDKYRNFHDTIFQHRVEASIVIFNNKPDPIIIIIRAKEASDCDFIDDPLLHDAVKCERGSCPEFESWIGSVQKARM
jgi:hypothetical protein